MAYIGKKPTDKPLTGSDLNDEIVDKSVMSIKQDVKLLSEKIVKLGYRGLIDVLKKGNLSVDNIDHFLPHLSSYFFEDKIYCTSYVYKKF